MCHYLLKNSFVAFAVIVQLIQINATALKKTNSSSAELFVQHVAAAKHVVQTNVNDSCSVLCIDKYDIDNNHSEVMFAIFNCNHN
jgi:hypothetical protein